MSCRHGIVPEQCPYCEHPDADRRRNDVTTTTPTPTPISPEQDITAADLTDELEAARRVAARALDRAAALADLRLRLLEATNRKHRPFTLAELFTEAEDRSERDYAALQALVDRITGDSFNPPIARGD